MLWFPPFTRGSRHAARPAPLARWALLCAALLWFGLPQAAARELRLVYEEYPPYEYSEDGQAQGINVDIIREACKRLQLTPRFLSVPWMRALRMVRGGDADGIFSLFSTAERLQFLYFPSEPLSLERNVLVATADATPVIKRLDDLKGLRVGVVAGNSYGIDFDSSAWIARHPVTGSEGLLRKQAAGRTDVSVSNEWVARFLSQKLALEERLVFLDYTVSTEPLYVAFAKAKGEQSKALSESFARVLRQMRQEGVIDAIVAKHLASLNSPADG